MMALLLSIDSSSCALCAADSMWGETALDVRALLLLVLKVPLVVPVHSDRQ
jgi:hypothetical protein